MRKYFSISATIFAAGAFLSQVTIGKTVNSALPANTSVSIEFGNPAGGVQGLVLPWVTSAAGVTSPALGTFIFDSADQKVKLRLSTLTGGVQTPVWTDLSAGAAAPIPANTNVPDDNPETASARTVIGTNAASDTTPGILVLSDVNKAMILPRVPSHTSVINPSAGMMVYVTSTSQLAVFNGREWSFWTKP